MRERVFDESYNIREVLDDVIERLTVREKLIHTAKQFAEKKKEERYILAIKQFENLMADFLRLYGPVLDRLRSYKESLEKQIQGLRSGLATVSGMLEVTRGIETLAAKVQQLEADGQDLDNNIKEKTRILEKIDDLFNRLRPFTSGLPSPSSREPLSDILGNMPKDLFPDLSETTKEIPGARRSAGRGER